MALLCTRPSSRVLFMVELQHAHIPLFPGGFSELLWQSVILIRESVEPELMCLEVTALQFQRAFAGIR
jgi:hypothetical protein